MNIIKFFLKEDLSSQSNLLLSDMKRINATKQLRKVKIRRRDIDNKFSIPVSFDPQNSGITASRYNHPQKFKFTEFILPGDALLQKTYSSKKI